jgi:UDPglucose 6-dehydrogenase
MKITVVGLGYVGLANAAMLAREHEVIGLDIDFERVLSVNSAHAPFADSEMDNWLTSQPLKLWATDDEKVAYRGADYIVVAVPTNYSEATGCFDTSIVERVVEEACFVNPKATIVIRSTVPVGFTEQMIARTNRKILFVPEFLREGHALLDTLNPSRILIGAPGDATEDEEFGRFLDHYAGHGYSVMPNSVAEAVKLFSNTYLAMRVAFFNELDTFAIAHDLEPMLLNYGVTGDPRIGGGYNNPSFGYGGYCLPKDTKQLRANYSGIPQTLISAIITSNERRKDFIASDILARIPIKACEEPVVGIYRLTMKSGSDNTRDSAVQGVIDRLKSRVTVLVYEPELDEATFNGVEVVANLDEFLARSHLVIANRYDESLDGVRRKVYTRDLFQRD